MKYLFIILVSTISIVNANAQDIRFENAHIRETIGKTNIASAYITIINDSKVNDKLISIKSTLTDKIELHSTKIDNNANATMQHIHSVNVKANEQTQLKPTKDHIMIMDLEQKLLKDERYILTLVFEKAGEIDVEFIVKSLKDTLLYKHDDTHNH